MAQSELELCNSALSKLGCRVKLTTVSTSGTTQEERACASRVDICKRTVLAMHPWNFAIKRTNLEPVYTSITNVSSSGGLIKITKTAHGFSTGNRVTIKDVAGTTEANGTWFITKVDADNFTLDDSTYSNAYTTGGSYTQAATFDFIYSIALPSDCLRVLRVNDEMISPDWRIEAGRMQTNSDSNYLKYTYNVTDYTTMSIMFYEALSLYLAWDISLELGRDNQTKEQLGRDFKEVLAKARFVDATEDPAEQIEASDWVASRLTYTRSNYYARAWNA